MYKIAITGKANSGKNTVSKLLFEKLWDTKFIVHPQLFTGIKCMAFADPIKEMIHIAYPEIPRKWLYGPSKYRSEIIPGAFYKDQPLTVRQLLINLGNDFGRANKPDIWLRNFDNRLNKQIKKKTGTIIVTDCRFRNEFDHLKNLGFYQIRLLRITDIKINDVSETNQDGIYDAEFDYVLNNNGTLNNLRDEVKNIILQLKP